MAVPAHPTAAGQRRRHGADRRVDEARADAALARLRLRVAAGARPDGVAELPDDVRGGVAVAEAVGAPLLAVLDAAAAARGQRLQVARQIRTATAPARTVALALVLLPVVVVPVLASLLDIDLAAFYATGVGTVVGALAVGLWATGAAMIAGLVARAGRDPRPAGPTGRVVVAALVAGLLLAPWAAIPAALVARATFRPAPQPPHRDLAEACDLVATALSAGLAVPAALREVAPHLPGLGGDLRRLAWQVELGRPGRAASRGGAPGVPDPLRRLATTLADGLEAGGPLVPVLRTLARTVRAERGAAAEAEALRLPARLTFPTTLCLLPATALSIGAPIVVTGLSAVAGT